MLHLIFITQQVPEMLFGFTFKIFTLIVFVYLVNMILPKVGDQIECFKILSAHENSSSSSFPLAFPVIWGRRYGC